MEKDGGVSTTDCIAKSHPSNLLLKVSLIQLITSKKCPGWRGSCSERRLVFYSFQSMEPTMLFNSPLARRASRLVMTKADIEPVLRSRDHPALDLCDVFIDDEFLDFIWIKGGE